MAMVKTQLQTFEAQINAKFREWTASIVKGCKEMEEQLDALEGI